MENKHDAESVLEGRDIFDWANLADELAFALRELMPHPTDAAASCYDRQRAVLARYDAVYDGREE